MEQAHLTVGRAWDTNLNNGPKMINTVIGVDNGHFLKILQDSRKKEQELDARVSDLEAKMDGIANGIKKYQVDAAELAKKNAKIFEDIKTKQQPENPKPDKQK